MINNMANKPIISIKNSFIIAVIILISFISIKLLTRNVLPFNMNFGNIFLIIINIMVVLALIYATVRSAGFGQASSDGLDVSNISTCFFYGWEYIRTWNSSETHSIPA